ncbi:GT-D fold domain-containing protein [Halomonas sp. CSM-2]|uniref:GT-D fold domain-containing protein n=1 Tax=Halomonas sp. CSM-2 TaxID=1975722 RepID=UPI000A284A59|nr:sulfotransferase family 2 domain-containing protein [Halomonas sp. CSM-2]
MKNVNLSQYLASSSFNKYLDDLEAYIKENSWDKNSYLDFLQVLVKSGCYIKFENYIESFFYKYPDNNIAHRIYGKYHIFVKKDLKKALIHLNKACEINPEEPSWVRYYTGKKGNYYESVAKDVLYTAIPKNGSTTIKGYIASKEDKDVVNPHKYFGNPYFKFNYFDRERIERSKRVLILREPVQRVVSYHAKNIIEESSLIQEVGHPKQNKLYGLSLKPTLEEFLEKFWEYVFCFNDVFHHLLPQSAYVTNINEYTFVGDMKGINDSISHIEDNGGGDINVPVLMKGSSGRNNKLSEREEEFLKKIYSDDFNLLVEAGLLKEMPSAGEKISFIPSNINEADKEKVLVEYNNRLKALEKKMEWLEVSNCFLRNIITDSFHELTSRIINASECYGFIVESVASKRPFSLVRMGDGEGLIAEFNGLALDKDVEDILKVHFGKGLQEKDIETMKSGILNSIKSSDIIGVPSHRRSNKTNPVSRIQRGIFCVYSTLSKYSGLDEKFVVGANIHIELERYGVLEKLLGSVEKINIITCRVELAEILKERFHNLINVNLIEIPAEYKYGEKKVDKHHYYDVFDSVVEEIKGSSEGEFYLVAAGLLGKIYCHNIKLSGGMAIDIGSIADAWAGVNSRPYIRSMC